MNIETSAVAKETSVVKCKKCEQVKTRYLSARYKSGDKKWVDEQGKMWNGHVCPSCNVSRAKEGMRASRAKP